MAPQCEPAGAGKEIIYHLSEALLQALKAHGARVRFRIIKAMLARFVEGAKTKR